MLRFWRGYKVLSNKLLKEKKYRTLTTTAFAILSLLVKALMASVIIDSSEKGGSGGGGAAESPVIESPENGGGSGRVAEYAGWIYHLGVNSIGHQYCHLRYLVLRGIKVLMYKRDPHDSPGIKPIRKGVVSHSLVVEELGRKKLDTGDLYVLKFYNKLDESKKGEIACATPGELRKWFEAFEQAKQQAESDLMGRGRHRRLTTEDELNLVGHRPRVRRYAKKLIKIGKGPEMLLRQASKIKNNNNNNNETGDDTGDAVEAHDWRCVRTFNGIRIFEDAANSKGGKGVLLKSVGVINANIDAVFEVIFSLDTHKRHEWDVLTSELELVDTIDGHIDIVYATYHPKFLTRWNSKKDFVFSRQWFHGQDGTYTILQFPHEHKKKPKKSGYQRIKINPSIWEIRRLSSNFGDSKCLVTQMVEIQTNFWQKWTKNGSEHFEKSIPFSLLCQVAGLREYFEANPSLTSEPAMETVQSRFTPDSSIPSSVNSGIEDNNNNINNNDDETNEAFYDAISFGEDEDTDDDDDDDDDDNEFEDAGFKKEGKVKLKNVSWAIASLALKRSKVTLERDELNTSSNPVIIDSSQFKCSLRRAKNEQDSNCWSSPSGNNFMIRGKTYLTDHSKIAGGDPLLKLIGVDWLKSEVRMDNVALNTKSLVQSEAGKKVPFIFVVNLQIPSKPNYSLVAYYGSEREINKESLLARFVDGDNLFRDTRFKLIPSIVEGYWMVKRAVGTKACLLGKAVTCNYLRQDNFLEIDVDIGSSSVARSIIGLVLGYVTGIVVDLAILIEGKEEKELPEYILGTVRLNRLKPESAISL